MHAQLIAQGPAVTQTFGDRRDESLVSGASRLKAENKKPAV
jgi:hypothetical protein